MPSVTINAELCKGCELCVEACPKKIIVIGNAPNGQGYFTAVWEDDAHTCTGMRPVRRDVPRYRH